MSGNEYQWGSASWFDKLYREQGEDSPAAYFAYDKNGYQKFRHDRLISLISSHINIFKSAGDLIDIGSATGHLTYKLGAALSAKVVTGIDFSPELVKGARGNFANIAFLQGGLPKLPLENQAADVISLIEVLYYVNKAERPDSIAECMRLLRPGGVLIFAANVQGPPYLTRQEVIDLLTGVGFKIEQVFDEPYGFAVLGEKTLRRIHRLCNRVLNPDSAGNSGRRRLAKMLPYFQNPAGRFPAKLAMTIAVRLISYKAIFVFLSFLNRMLPSVHASHIIIFARRT